MIKSLFVRFLFCAIHTAKNIDKSTRGVFSMVSIIEERISVYLAARVPAVDREDDERESGCETGARGEQIEDG